MLYLKIPVDKRNRFFEVVRIKKRYIKQHDYAKP